VPPQEEGDLTYLDTICETPLVRLRRVLPGPVQQRHVSRGLPWATVRMLTYTNLFNFADCACPPEQAQQARVLGKLEMQNPGGSVKDRIALGLITGAEAAGKIVPGRTTVIEYTSGNTAIGLAMVCAAKGYKCVLVMPQLPVMMERYMICRSFGAEV
jgi:cysteine synthase